MALSTPIPLGVTALIRALDTGPRLERVWRQVLAIGEDGLRVRRDLPFEPGRPVGLTFVLPDDDDTPLTLTGLVTEVAAATTSADDHDEREHDEDPLERAARLAADPELANDDPDRPRPRGVRFVGLEPAIRARLRALLPE